MKTRRYTYLLIVIAALLTLQSCGIQRRIKKADKRYAIGEYYEAGEAYRKIYKHLKNSDKALRGSVAFKQGECYYHINNARALQAYQNAIRCKYADSTLYLHYAQMLHYQGKYADAAKQYQQYLTYDPQSYVAQSGLYACQQVNEWKKQYSRYQVSEMKVLNDKRSSTYSPAYIGEDADALMFTSNRTDRKKKDKKNSSVTGAPYFMLYSTRRDAQGKWLEIEMAEGLSGEKGSDGADNAEAKESDTGKGDAAGSDGGTTISKPDKDAEPEFGSCTFTADGKTMYFTYSRAMAGMDQGAQIYKSERASGTWGEPQLIKLFADSTITVGHPTLSHSGDTLYFTSDAPGGYGGKDLYMAEYIDGMWLDVRNLGPLINTAGDEMFPTIAPDGTLYFASNGHPGYGGLDLFKAERHHADDPATNALWAQLDSAITMRYDSAEIQRMNVYGRCMVYNLGAPFCSTGDDFGITFAPVGRNSDRTAMTEGFFSSNRGQKKGLDMLYSFILPEMIVAVEGTVRDNTGEVVSGGTLRLVGDNGRSTKVQIRRDGTYRLKLEPNVRYAMLATARGYLNERQLLETAGLKDSHTYTMDFTLTTLSKPMTMDNIFYEFGRWTLTPESETGLNALVKLLNDNPNITIELSANTDMKGNAAYNKDLSEKRAQSVVSYLIQHGIAADRLTPVGYGKENPVKADATLNKKYPFIPVDQVLSEEFILSLPSDQQEICNQINRRTEFKVLKTTYGLY